MIQSFGVKNKRGQTNPGIGQLLPSGQVRPVSHLKLTETIATNIYYYYYFYFF